MREIRHLKIGDQMNEEVNVRQALLEGLLRIRLGTSTQSTGRLTVKAVADEANCGRHHLTQRHRDIETFIKLVAEDHRAARGKVQDPAISELREALDHERSKNRALAAQNAIVLAALDALESPQETSLRVV